MTNWNPPPIRSWVLQSTRRLILVMPWRHGSPMRNALCICLPGRRLVWLGTSANPCLQVIRGGSFLSAYQRSAGRPRFCRWDWIEAGTNSIRRCRNLSLARRKAAGIWFTDPPYYDAIPYSDLSDFFLVWLKRALPDHPLLRDPFDPDNPLSPKTREAVQERDQGMQRSRQGSGVSSRTRWGAAFAEGRRVLGEDGVGSVVFAHKTTEGWEALLNA